MRRDAAAIQAARMHPSARFLILHDLKPLMAEGGVDLFWARRSECPEGLTIFLGLNADGEPRFAVDGKPDDDLPARATLKARVRGEGCMFCSLGATDVSAITEGSCFLLSIVGR